MMILSRLWYLILAIFLAGAYYIVALAVGQYNRRNQAAMEETLKADSQVVSWALQVDARRRLDTLLGPAYDATIVKAIRNANGKEVPAASREDGAKALRAFNEKLADYKHDALFITDRDGRLVAQTGYDAVNAFPEFELGGYPSVNDALHGFLRDDTWVWGGRIARVVTRPVEEEVGQLPIGAVVGIRWIDQNFAKELAKRTRTNLAFFALGQRVAHAATIDGFEENTLEALGSELKAVADDKGFKENGRTDVRPLPDPKGESKGGILFVRLPGDTVDLGGGFAVARSKVAITSPTGFISGADDVDKSNVKLWLVAVVFGVALLFGVLFSYLEHSLPLKNVAIEAAKLKKGETDVLPLPRFRGAYRAIAADVNAGIQRVVEKGGGTARKPADLESILGPVPAQPNMSAFTFPLQDGSAQAQQVPQLPSNFGANPPPHSQNARFPGGPPPPPASRPGSGFADRTVAMGAPPPPASAQGPFTPPGASSAVGSHSATVAAVPKPQTAPAFPPKPKPAPPREEPPEEATTVAQPTPDLIAAAGPSGDPIAEWQGVYEEFLKTKRECGEATEGLTFEKFQQTLRKNRDALMQRHGCKRVKFAVYVKEGRASLKATPVRE
jgi:hypothetical protein